MIFVSHKSLSCSYFVSQPCVTVKPRVRFLQKTLPDSGGVKVTCLATGFYPRHINLTLLRDGQPVSDHQITGGDEEEPGGQRR